MFYTNFAKDYEEIFPYRENIYSFLHSYLKTKNTRILDIGCATGHYCGKFSSEGYNVSGIDLDSAMIDMARKYYRDPEFKVLNLTDLQKIKITFDLVYSTGNVMAHISAEDFTSFLQSLKRKLTERGIWIFQVINWDYILKLNEFDFPIIETGSKIFHRKYTEITSKDLIFTSELKNKPDGTSVFKDKVRMYPLSSEAYIKMHENMGFKLLGQYKDYRGGEYSPLEFSANIFVFTL